MKIVDFTLDSMTSVMTFIPNSPFSIIKYLCMVFFTSQLIRYARVSSKYEYFLFRGSILVSELLSQGYYSRFTSD